MARGEQRRRPPPPGCNVNPRSWWSRPAARAPIAARQLQVAPDAVLGPQARLTSALGVPVERVTELMIDPSYTTGARCLDTLIQDRRAAVGISRALSNRAY